MKEGRQDSPTHPENFITSFLKEKEKVALEKNSIGVVLLSSEGKFRKKK